MVSKPHKVNEKRYYSHTHPVKVLSINFFKEAKEYPNAVNPYDYNKAKKNKTFGLYEALSDEINKENPRWKKGDLVILYTTLCFRTQF